MKFPTGSKTSARTQVTWIVGAAVVGFAASAIFAGELHLTRNAFLLPYGTVTAVFLYAYFRWSGVDLVAHFAESPLLGLAGAVVAGMFVVWNVLSQPASPRPEGGGLILSVLWVGVVYGVLEALLLSVMPVVATGLAVAHGGLIVKPSRRETAVFSLSPRA